MWLRQAQQQQSDTRLPPGAGQHLESQSVHTDSSSVACARGAKQSAVSPSPIQLQVSCFHRVPPSLHSPTSRRTAFHCRAWHVSPPGSATPAQPLWVCRWSRSLCSIKCHFHFPEFLPAKLPVAQPAEVSSGTIFQLTSQRIAGLTLGMPEDSFPRKKPSRSQSSSELISPPWSHSPQNGKNMGNGSEQRASPEWNLRARLSLKERGLALAGHKVWAAGSPWEQRALTGQVGSQTRPRTPWSSYLPQTLWSYLFSETRVPAIQNVARAAYYKDNQTKGTVYRGYFIFSLVPIALSQGLLTSWQTWHSLLSACSPFYPPQVPNFGLISPF